MKKLLLQLFLLLLLSIPAVATPVEILDYTNTTGSMSISDILKIRHHRGDNPLFSDPGFDDSHWQVTTLPNHWRETLGPSNDIVWYRFRIRFPESPPEKALAIRLGVIIDSDELYLNGTLIGTSGSIQPHRSAYDRQRYYEIPHHLIRQGEVNTFALRVKGTFPRSNGPSGGIFLIGSLERIQRDILMKDLFDTIFIAIYLVFFVFFLAFYKDRPLDRANLWFALFALSVSIYFFMRTQLKYHLGLDFFWCKRIEYLVLIFVMPFSMAFVRTYFNRPLRFFHYINWGLTALFSATILISNSFQFWSKVNQYGLQISWLFIPIPYMLGTLVVEARKNRDARVMLYAIAVLLATSLNDSLLDREIIESIRLSQYGFLAFTGVLALILNQRFVRMHNEIENLNLTLEDKVEQRTEELQSAMEELQAVNEYVTYVNEMNERDLNLASKLQRNLIPPPMSTKYWQSAAWYRPATTLSGDYYDFYEIHDHGMGIVLTDVSGHGVGSALITMIAKPLLYQGFARKKIKLRQIATDFDTELTSVIGGIDNYMTGLFVTLGKDTVHIVNAGHPPALYYSHKRRKVYQIEATGMFMGVKGFPSTYQTIKIEPHTHDMLLLYTDSLIESRKGSEEFGLDRVEAILQKGHESPSDLIQELKEELTRFTGTATLNDDLTIVAVRKIK